MLVPRFLPAVCLAVLAAGAAYAQAPTVPSDHLISWQPPIGRSDGVLSRQVTALADTGSKGDIPAHNPGGGRAGSCNVQLSSCKLQACRPRE